jgi:hypothetical protein
MRSSLVRQSRTKNLSVAQYDCRSIVGDSRLNFRWLYRKAQRLSDTETAAPSGQIDRLEHV